MKRRKATQSGFVSRPLLGCFGGKQTRSSLQQFAKSSFFESFWLRRKLATCASRKTFFSVQPHLAAKHDSLSKHTSNLRRLLSFDVATANCSCAQLSKKPELTELESISGFRASSSFELLTTTAQRRQIVLQSKFARQTKARKTIKSCSSPQLQTKRTALF